MKTKLIGLTSLIMGVLLIIETMPVLAVGNGPSNMPGDTAYHLISDVLWAISYGWYQGYTNSEGAAQLYGLYATSHTFWHLFSGTPPAKPHWAG